MYSIFNCTTQIRSFKNLVILPTRLTVSFAVNNNNNNGDTNDDIVEVHTVFDDDTEEERKSRVELATLLNFPWMYYKKI